MQNAELKAENSALRQFQHRRDWPPDSPTAQRHSARTVEDAGPYKPNPSHSDTAIVHCPLSIVNCPLPAGSSRRRSHRSPLCNVIGMAIPQIFHRTKPNIVGTGLPDSPTAQRHSARTVEDAGPYKPNPSHSDTKIVHCPLFFCTPAPKYPLQKETNSDELVSFYCNYCLGNPAVSAPSPTRPSRFAASSRILYFRTLPAAFMGKLSTNSIYFGTLCRAMLALM